MDLRKKRATKKTAKIDVLPEPLLLPYKGIIKGFDIGFAVVLQIGIMTYQT
jgi:hypothetical protein